MLRGGLLIALFCISSASAALAQSIDWEIKDRFRVLKAPGAGQTRHLDQDAYADRVISIRDTKGYEPLIPLPDGSIGAVGAELNWTTTWNERDRQYSRSWLHEKTRDIRISLRGLAGGSTCVWLDLGNQAVPCEPRTIKGVALDTERKIDVIVRRQGAVDKPLSVTVKPRDVFIAVMGDSYVSGEGNPHVAIPKRWETRGPYPAQWWDTRCHRSLLSSSAQAAGFLAASNPKQSVTYVSYACSGAEIKDGLLTHYSGRQTVWQTKAMWEFADQGTADKDAVLNESGGKRDDDDRLPKQIDVLAAALCQPGSGCSVKRRPDILIIAIGGNDVAFGEIARDLLLSNPPSDPAKKKLWEENLKNKIGDRFVELGKDYRELAKAVRETIAPARVFLNEYIDPSVYSLSKTKDAYCGTKSSGQPRARYQRYRQDYDSQIANNTDKKISFAHDNSLYNTLLTTDEAKLAQWVVQGLNKTINQAAADEWVETSPKQASVFKIQDLRGPDDLRRGLCSPNTWFLTIFDSWKRQFWIPQDEERKNRYELHLSDVNNCPVSVENGKCKVAPGPVTSGVMHPNFFGHYNIGQVMLRTIKASLGQAN
jgi:lysophospholipase L1-like esterase